MALGDVIARLSVHLGLETAAFEKGSRKAVKETETLGKKMTRIAGVIGTAFVASIGVDTVRAWADATKGALEYAGSLGETAQQLGVTTSELQEFRYVATQTGIEQSQMDKALQKTTRTLGELATPTKAQAEAMRQLGLSAKELEGIGTGDFLVLLADKFKGLTAAEQAALGAQLGLGKSFQTLIPLLNEGSLGIEKMREEAHKLGIVISETAIQNADKNADLISTYEQIATAQQNAALTMPENVKAYLAYEKTITDLQVSLYKFIASLGKFGAEWQRVNDQATVALAPFREAVAGFLSATTISLADIGRAWKAAKDGIVNSARAIYEGAKPYLEGLTRVLLAVVNPIQTVQNAFRTMWDKVVGHSYVPDMVDGIAAHMARLFAVMVKPAEKATEATARKFQDLRDLLDRLFPEVGKAGQFNADTAAIEASGLSAAEKEAASGRLWREFASGSPLGSGGAGGPDFGSDGGPIGGMKNVGEAIERLTEKSKIGTVQIAKSFADMATDTLKSLQQLTNAIKGGGFLDILTSVANLALQLGQSGAFGSKVSGFLNKVPAHAAGTNFAPGGLSLVGERGPELVQMPRGSRVFNNRDSRAMMGGGGITVNVHANDAVLAETVKGWVAEGVGVAINGSMSRIARQRDRALA